MPASPPPPPPLPSSDSAATPIIGYPSAARAALRELATLRLFVEDVQRELVRLRKFQGALALCFAGLVTVLGAIALILSLKR